MRHYRHCWNIITIFFKPFNFKTIWHLTELSTKYSCRYNDCCHDNSALSKRYFLVDFSNKMFPYISTFLRLLEKCRKYSSQTKYLSENYKNPQRRSSGKFLFSKFTYKIHIRYLLQQWHWFIDYLSQPFHTCRAFSFLCFGFLKIVSPNNNIKVDWINRDVG